MGSSMAPDYASLFMGEVWGVRFKATFFLLLDHSLDDLQLFVDSLNNYH